MEPELRRLRSSLKFSLWAWAAYWPGGGLMLLAGGMADPVSVAVALGCVACFVLLLATGALRAEEGRPSLRQWMFDRPFYLLGAVAVFVAVGATLSSAAKVGLVLFSALYLGSLLVAAHALHRHVRASGLQVYASRADQLFILLGAMAIPATLVLLDAMGSGTSFAVGNPAFLVAAFNILNLLYPPLLLVAARPFREPLRMPRRQPADPTAPAADDATAA